MKTTILSRPPETFKEFQRTLNHSEGSLLIVGPPHADQPMSYSLDQILTYITVQGLNIDAVMILENKGMERIFQYPSRIWKDLPFHLNREVIPEEESGKYWIDVLIQSYQLPQLYQKIDLAVCFANDHPILLENWLVETVHATPQAPYQVFVTGDELLLYNTEHQCVIRTATTSMQLSLSNAGYDTKITELNQQSSSSQDS